ncbi:hypothetical protein J4403_04790 [Candidatus Woesearchaeota archaeon]|nr:hypothetical protein [Candidatus Woesearchaeota archaeon]
MKKGQLEMVGLVIIVILLLVGLVIYAVLNKPNDTESKKEESIRANNMRNSILLTSLCNTQTKYAIQKCNEDSSFAGCNTDCKAYITQMLKKGNNPVSDELYNLKVTFESGSETKTLYSIGSCKKGITSTTDSVPSSVGNYRYSFILCD